MTKLFIGQFERDDCYKTEGKKRKLYDSVDLEQSAILYHLEKIENSLIINSREYWGENLIKKYAIDIDKVFYPTIRPKCIMKVDLKSLRVPAFLIEIEFTLARPYFSRDDEIFYYLQNLVRKDHVFKVPMVAASTWKGKIRWIGMKKLTDFIVKSVEENPSLNDQRIALINQGRERLIWLFGNETDTEKNYLDYYFEATGICFADYLKTKNLVDKNGSYQGNLNFFSTYFDKIGYEITNKLTENRTGTNPITYEVAAKGSQGVFQLFYLPQPLTERSSDEIKEDIEFIRELLYDLFFVYGFSAKGDHWGVIDEDYTFSLCRSNKDDINQLRLDRKIFGGERNV